MSIPAITTPPSSTSVPATVGKHKAKPKWNFSFKYWRQIKFFVLFKSTPPWIVSLLEKLQGLSEEDIDDFFSNPRKKTAYRYHPINWSQKNIPIQRKELKWLHPDYLTNEEEYPLVQFQISKALGRIVGFFDENRIFNIILFDPLHNIQPSKHYNYKVDSCYPLSCEISSLKHTLESLISSNDCSTPNCKLFSGVENIDNHYSSTNVLIVNVEDIDIKDAEDIIANGKCATFAEFFQLGILAASDK